ncbi:MAG TPA: ATP-binding protein [Candidatus Kryptonia bacterium]
MIENFTSFLKVDKQIVPLLSKSTYTRNFPYALRELVSNAYDADALSVYITISEDLSSIEIEDDGNGMSKEEFQYYCTIAGQRRDVKLSRKYKRKRIGQFGIGFLSIFPFCEALQIATSVENSPEVLTARIPAGRFFDIDSPAEIADIPIEGTIVENRGQTTKHFTRFTLVKPTYLVKQYFTVKKTKERKTIKNWEPLDRLSWELQDDLPISLPPNSPLGKILKYEEPIGLDVFLNRKQLQRNDPGKHILDHGTEKIGGIEYKYAITTDWDAISPVEARGLKIRISNVGIGKRTDFELKRSRGFSRLHQLSGEVMISEALKNFLNISRDGLVSNDLVDSILDSISEKFRLQAYYVDHVNDAQKSLEDILGEERKIILEPKQDIIGRNLDKLKKLGFKVVTHPRGSADAGREPIKIDKFNKTVYMKEEVDEIVVDRIKVLGKFVKVKYSKWDYEKSEYPSCRLTQDDSVEINQGYPLFSSKQYGTVFKRIHIMLLLLNKKNESSADLLKDFMNNFLKEFDEQEEIK